MLIPKMSCTEAQRVLGVLTLNLNFSCSMKVSKPDQFYWRRQALAPLRKPTPSFGISKPYFGNFWESGSGVAPCWARMGPGPPSHHLHLVLMPAEPSHPGSRAGSPGAEGPPLVVFVSKGSRLAGAEPSPRFPQERRRGVFQSDDQNVLASPAALRSGPAHFCLDACWGGVGMAT